MFFIMGVNDRQETLRRENMIVHSACARYGMVEIQMIQSVFSLFFIPLIRFNRRYYAYFHCCDRSYPIRKEAGEELRSSPERELRESDLLEATHQNPRCRSCGYLLQEDFEFCPKCGDPIK